MVAYHWCMRTTTRKYTVLSSAVYVGDKRFERGECVGPTEMGLSLRRLVAAGVLKAVKPEIKPSLRPSA